MFKNIIFMEIQTISSDFRYFIKIFGKLQKHQDLKLLINDFLNFFYKIFFTYKKMSKDSSAKYYQNNKRKTTKNVS